MSGFAARLAPRSPAAVGGGVAVGFNFRSTLGSGDDGPIDYFAHPIEDLWPVTFSGKLSDVRAGWFGGFSSSSSDLGGTDQRISGNAIINSPNVRSWRVELPAGDYRFYMASGGSSTSTRWSYLDLYDGISDGNRAVVHSFSELRAQSTNTWRRARDELFVDESTWVAGYDVDYISITITDRGEMNDVDQGTGLSYQMFSMAGAQALNHFRMVQV